VSETLKDDTQEKEPSSGAPGSERAKGLLRRTRILLGTMAAVLIVGAVVAGVVIYKNDHGNSAPSATPVGPVGLSESGLRTLAASVGQPIYWAGPRKDYLYELTRTRDRKIFIRYLPPGASVGAKKPYLTIATYPYPDALQALTNVAHGRQQSLPGGGIALVDVKYPKSIHLAYRRVNYEIVVFDPSPARSRQIALSGDVRPVR